MTGVLCTVYGAQVYLKESFEEKSYDLPLYLRVNGIFFKSLPPPPRYSYSRLAWLYIHKKEVDRTNGVLYLGGGGGNVIHDFWYLGKWDEGDTKLLFFFYLRLIYAHY